MTIVWNDDQCHIRLPHDSYTHFALFAVMYMTSVPMLHDLPSLVDYVASELRLRGCDMSRRETLLILEALATHNILRIYLTYL